MNRFPVHSRALIVGGLLVALLIAGWLILARTASCGFAADPVDSVPGDVCRGTHRLCCPNRSRKTEADRQIAKLSPSDDGWDSEVVSAAIDHQLGRLRDGIQSTATSELPAMTTDDFAGEMVRPDALQPIFADHDLPCRASAGRPGRTATDDISVRRGRVMGGQECFRRPSRFI